MAESSMPWEGTTVGDATIAPYDASLEFAQILRAVSGACETPNLGGVCRSVTNQLASSVAGAVSPVNINTGEAVVHGTFYQNTASVAIAVPNSVASRYDRIVLRKDWTAQTVRLTRIQGVEGGGVPALVQISGTTWDIPICTVRVQVAVLTINSDDREYLPYRIIELVGRQGNASGINWYDYGTTNFYPGKAIEQVGVVLTIDVGAATAVAVTFPVVFSSAPQVQVTPLSNPGAATDCLVAVVSSPITAAGFTVYSWFIDGAGPHKQVTAIMWRAIGSVV